MKATIQRQYKTILVSYTALFSLVAAIYVLNMQAHGLTKLEVNISNMCFMIGLVLFEIPTGIIADAFGRKTSMIIGHLLWAISGVVFFFAASLFGFIIAELIAAVGYTCISGALDAWVTESLNHHGEKVNNQGFFARSLLFATIPKIILSVIGGYLGDYNLTFPYIVFTLGHLFLGFYVYRVVREEYFEKKLLLTREHFNPFLLSKVCFNIMKEIYNTSVSFTRKSKVIQQLLIIEVGYYFGCQALNMYWSLYYRKYSSVSNLGYVWVGITIMFALGYYIAEKTKEYTDRSRLLAFSCIYSGIFVAFSLSVSWYVYSIIFFCIHEIGRALYDPVVKGIIYDEVSDKGGGDIAATVASFVSMIGSVGRLGGLLSMGYIAEYYSITFSWLISVFVLIFFGGVYYFITRKARL